MQEVIPCAWAISSQKFINHKRDVHAVHAAHPSNMV